MTETRESSNLTLPQGFKMEKYEIGKEESHRPIKITLYYPVTEGHQEILRPEDSVVAGMCVRVAQSKTIVDARKTGKKQPEERLISVEEFVQTQVNASVLNRTDQQEIERQEQRIKAFISGIIGSTTMFLILDRSKILGNNESWEARLLIYS